MGSPAARQRGFTYLGLLMAVVVMGLMLTIVARIWTTTEQRERETQLLFAGHQFRNAIAGYFARRHQYPQTLQDLLGEPDATLPQRYLRRLYLDIIGMPPSRDEVETFVKAWDAAGAKRGSALENVVDRLLASPAFGERWARHWLDLVRYAETLGHEFDYPIQNAWRYRDYVIRAFNRDLPYDQFVTEHVAGDLLPHPRFHPTEHFNESVIGTAFFWLGQRDHSPVDVRQHQAELIDNQIDVMCKTFLGLTVSCARCHDHKFDAISTMDFYSLYGVLESSRYTQRETDAIAQSKIQALRELKKKIRNVAVSEWFQQCERFTRVLVNTNASAEPSNPLYPWAKLSALPAASAQQLHETWNNILGEALSHAPSRLPTNSQLFASAVRGHFDGWFPDGDAFRLTTAGEENFVVGDSNITILSRPAVDDRIISRRLEGSLRSPGVSIAHAYGHVLAAGRDARIRVCVDNLTMIRDPIYGGLMKYLNQDQLEWITFDLRMWQGHRAYIELCDTRVPDPSDDGRKEGYGNSGWISANRVVFSDDSAPPAATGTPVWVELLGRHAPDSLDALAARYQTAFKAALRTWASGKSDYSNAEWAQLELLESIVKSLGSSSDPPAQPSPLRKLIAEYHRIEASLPDPVRVPAMADGDGFSEHVFIRGNHKSLGELAPRKFLTALSNGTPSPFEQGSGRLELARCMTDASDPLLARVMVNRIWLHLFGRGIVPTPDDFGKLGQSPTHPELLDWLANWYRTDARWSNKKLIRLLVTSSAYRMSSKPDNALAAEQDPDNLLLHRMPIRRLEGETIRDAILAIAGRLDRKMFAGQRILEVIPALERCERVEVMHRKVLTLYGTRLRQYFQCFCRPANLIQPCSQRGERFVG